MPAVAGQRAGADQHRAREPLGVRRGPASPHGPPKSCATRWARSIPSASSARPTNAACASIVCGKPRRVRAAEARRVPRDRAATLADSGQQRLPVGARARVAVQEDDGLARARRAGLAQRRAHAADAQLAPAHPVRALVPRRRRGTAQDARGDRRRAAALAGCSSMPTTAMNAPGHDGVALGRRVQAAQVGVQRAHAQRAAARRPAAARGRRRSTAARRGRSARAAARKNRRASPCSPLCQALAQRDRLGGGDRHALAVRRVERADRVAARQQARRGSGAAARSGAGRSRGSAWVAISSSGSAAAIASSTSGGATAAANAANAVGIGRRAMLGAVAAEREDPAPALLREQEQGAWAVRDGADQDQLLGARARRAGSRRWRLA